VIVASDVMQPVMMRLPMVLCSGTARKRVALHPLQARRIWRQPEWRPETDRLDRIRRTQV